MFTILSSFDYIAHDVTFALLWSHSLLLLTEIFQFTKLEVCTHHSALFLSLLPSSINYISTSCLDLSWKWRRTVPILVCVHMCVKVHIHMYACGGQRSILVSSSIVSTLGFEAGFSLWLDLNNTVRLADQWTSGTLLSLLPSARITGVCPRSSFLHGYLELNL